MEEKDAVADNMKEHCVDLVVRQTNYTKEEAITELIKYKYNYLQLLKDYMGIKPKKEKQAATSNQERYRLIRQTMDQVEENYAKKKKQKELMEKLTNNLQKS